MSRERVVTVAAAFLLTATPAAARATAPAPATLGSTPSGAAVCDRTLKVCGDADGDRINLHGGQAAGDSSTSPSSGNHPVALSPTIRFYDYSPACSGNGDRFGDVLCTGAISVCRQPGFISYWVWVRIVDRATGDPIQDWHRDGTTCLGPDDPGLSAQNQVAAYLATEFQRLMVLKAEIRVQPEGSTLVHYATGFYTPTRDYDLPAIPLLGKSVQVTAHPKSYTWNLGDGTELVDAGPGARDTLDVQHTYAQTGSVQVSLMVEWTATYRVDGGPVQQVFGTAQTTSLPAPLQVKQARAELVTR